MLYEKGNKDPQLPVIHQNYRMLLQFETLSCKLTIIKSLTGLETIEYCGCFISLAQAVLWNIPETLKRPPPGSTADWWMAQEHPMKYPVDSNRVRYRTARQDLFLQQATTLLSYFARALQWQLHAVILPLRLTAVSAKYKVAHSWKLPGERQVTWWE